MKTVEQAIHDYIWKSLATSMPVYEKRPLTEVAYPFADFDDSNTNFEETKSGTLAQVSIIINIWDTEDNRQNVSEKSYELIKSCQTNTMYGYPTSLRLSNTSINITQDRTVTPPIWRGMITMIFDI
jgi:hypothetical protein